MRRRGLFRDDSFDRLCSDVIDVPPLRQRLAETPGERRQPLEPVVAQLMGEAAAEPVDLVETTIERTVGRAYAWPGNVREVEQAVRRILLTGDHAGSSPIADAEPRGQLLAGLETGALLHFETLGLVMPS